MTHRGAYPSANELPDFKIHSNERRVDILGLVNRASTSPSVLCLNADLLHREHTATHITPTALETGYEQWIWRCVGQFTYNG
jgi:hypothetical protein